MVTLVNSAVENFNQRVEQFLDNSENLPGFQYRVRTLHGLANDIIRERPSIAGLANDYTILDERDSHPDHHPGCHRLVSFTHR